MNRTYNTLFLIESLDGKISTGDSDELDVDKDFADIVGVKEGLKQYYDLEKKTDPVSFNTGKVQAKIGVNERDLTQVKKDNVSFVLVDNKPHLNEHGCEYFAKRSKVFYVVTSNSNHPAFKLKDRYDNIEILHYKGEVDFSDVFRRLKESYGIERVTIQTGGTLNAVLLRNQLIDQIRIVVAPCLIGGKDTSTLVDGESLHSEGDLTKIKALNLIRCEQLENNYLLLEYEIINSTQVSD